MSHTRVGSRLKCVRRNLTYYPFRIVLVALLIAVNGFFAGAEVTKPCLIYDIGFTIYELYPQSTRTA